MHAASDGLVSNLLIVGSVLLGLGACGMLWSAEPRRFVLGLVAAHIGVLVMLGAFGRFHGDGGDSAFAMLILIGLGVLAVLGGTKHRSGETIPDPSPTTRTRS